MPSSLAAARALPDIAIVGGGWAGLSAAIELAGHGQRCIVLESAKQLGGRARTIALDGQQYDNGQHLFLGAYRNLLHLFKILSLQERDLFHRFTLTLDMRALDGSSVFVDTGNLFAPLHLLTGFIKARGLNWRDKMSVLRLWLYLLGTRFRLHTDLTLLKFLHQHHQTDRVIDNLWNPLCTAALNTPADRASAQVFIEVLRQAFTGLKNNSDLLLAKKTLGEIFPDPAREYLERNGSLVQCMSRVNRIITRNRKIIAIETGSGTIPVRFLVLATPFHITRKLLQDIDGCAELTRKLDKLQFEPINTLYLQYPTAIRLDAPMLGITGGHIQWLFNRTYTGQADTLGVVISARGPHMQMERQALIDEVVREIGQLFPRWPSPVRTHLVQEKQATFSCTVEAQALRPEMETPLEGCYLAGDYIKALLPATLETAAWSGLQCARRILENILEQP